MKQIIASLLIFFFITFNLHAQMPGGMGNRTGGAQNMNMGHFYGKIIDSNTNKGIEAASVQLLQFKLDSTTKKRKDFIVAGMLTTKKGEFSLENLSVMASYKLKITAIGYETIEMKVAFEMGGGKPGDMSSMLSGVDKDLGNIKLKNDAKQLDEVNVTSNKSLLTMGIDRKIFNVEKNLTSVGGTAADVMKNIPSLNVDIDGNVTLRNASPQIFVDGRPTTMTLEQIPADAIASVEIITNPSAKFDASGGGAGILNIVLKKNRKAGYNGNMRASIDSRARPGFGGDINIKQQKINFFASGNLGFRKSLSWVNTERTDYLKNATAHLSQNNAPIGTGLFGFGRTGLDYFIDNRNTITISASMSKGQFNNNDLLNTYRDTIFSNSSMVNDYGKRTSKSESRFQNIGTTLGFKHNFAKANKEITADINMNFSKNRNLNNFGTQFFFPNGTPKTNLQNERYTGGGETRFFTAQTDYANPITKKMKIEMGARIAIRNFTSFNDNYIQDPSTGQFITLPILNSKYKFTDRVLAAYGTFSQQLNKFSYQLGLRMESSKYDGTLITTGQKFSNEFPFSLFPSVFATYKLTEKQDMQINYSRKINRPNFFQLIPFIDFSDSLNLSRGNPGLIPEFTNLLELSHNNQIATGHSLLSTVYFKNTNGLIARYQYQDVNPNPAKPDSIIMTSYANASRSYTIGLELTAKNKITSWWDLTSNVNFFNATIEAGNIVGGQNSSQFSWFGKLSNNFKLPKNYSIQLSGDYQAKTLVAPGGGGGMRGGGGGMMFGGGNLPSAQGFIRPLYGVDIAFRKDFMKNNTASLTLQINDIFRTKLNGNFTQSIFFMQDVSRRRDPQVVRLNFNWRFGKFDVALFKRKNIKGEMENMQNTMQGMQ
jgi:outer membrane receptor protein involved in Fe transport